MQKEPTKFASLDRNSEGNFIFNDDNVFCTCEDGLKFSIPKSTLSLNADAIVCSVGDKLVQVQLDNLNNYQLDNVTDETSDANPDVAGPSSAITNESAKSKRNGADSSFSWNDESTRFFLSLYQENRKLVLCRKLKTFKAMWNHIANKMRDSGYNVSSLQVENKFKTMERAYKNMLSNNQKTGRGRATCSYESELSKILGNKHNILPVATSSSDGLRIRTNNTVDRTTGINAPQSILHPLQSLANKNVTDDIIKIDENLVDDKDSIDNASISNSSASIRKHKTGSTAKVVASCHKVLEDLAADRREQILKKEEFCKEFSDYMKKSVEQRESANNLRERKIVLMEHLIKTLGNKNASVD